MAFPLSSYLLTAVISALPVFELRAGIPWAIIRENLPWAPAAVAAVVGNFLPVVPVYLGVEKAAQFFSRYRRGRVFFTWLFARTRRKARGIRYSEFFGLALFVGVPLPVTGAWTGAVAASLLGIPRRRAIPAIGLGICLAALVVTLLTLGLQRGWQVVSPELARFFLRGSTAE